MCWRKIGSRSNAQRRVLMSRRRERTSHQYEKARRPLLQPRAQWSVLANS